MVKNQQIHCIKIKYLINWKPDKMNFNRGNNDFIQFKINISTSYCVRKKT